MERTTKEFKFVDVLDEIELYCDPCQYLGETWQDEQLDFEILSCERDANNHVVFSVKVSSSECNVENIAEQLIFILCSKYFHWNTRDASTRTLIVSYNGNLTSFQGHSWQDSFAESYTLVSVSPLYGNKWLVIICYGADELLDTLTVARAFDYEFNCPEEVTLNLNNAMLHMIEDMCARKGLNPNVKTFKK